MFNTGWPVSIESMNPVSGEVHVLLVSNVILPLIELSCFYLLTGPTVMVT